MTGCWSNPALFRRAELNWDAEQKSAKVEVKEGIKWYEEESKRGFFVTVKNKASAENWEWALVSPEGAEKALRKKNPPREVSWSGKRYLLNDGERLPADLKNGWMLKVIKDDGIGKLDPGLALFWLEK